MRETSWADGLLPDQPQWVRSLIEDEIDKRDKRIAELERTVGVCAGDYKVAHLRISELEAEIERLREQVARMPVVAGYVNEISLMELKRSSIAALIRVLPPENVDRRNHFAIYIDPPAVGEE